MIVDVLLQVLEYKIEKIRTYTSEIRRVMPEDDQLVDSLEDVVVEIENIIKER